ncbi:MAG: PilZ domain-containing protein [Planctomycetota bacterium]
MSTTLLIPTATDGAMGVAHQIASRQRAMDSIEERRRWPRNPLAVTTTLRTLSGVEIPACPTDNVSEGGLRLTMPIGFGLAVGQRYEVLLCQRGPDVESADLVGEGHYGTVVRTEIMLGGEGDDDRVGIGLRFDTPIAF